MESPSLNRTITRWPAILLVVSAIVGSGVFKKIAPMADALHSSGWILLCWLVAGLFSLMGALCTAELAAMMPGAGGEYVFFKRIYGRFFAFLYGWGNLTVMKMIASLLIIGLSFINHRGVVLGEKLSRYLIAAVIIAILGFCIAALGSSHGSTTHFTDAQHPPVGWPLIAAFFAAAVSAFWGYDGWNNIGYLGEEVINPQKNIPLALGIGTCAVIVLYLLVNAAYLYVVPVEELAAIHHAVNKIAAVEVARIISGKAGAVILSSLILLTTFTCTNSTILMSARVVYAIAKDKLFFSGAAVVHPTYKTPSHAIGYQCLWAIVLLWSGNFDQLTDLLIFASFIFYGATAFGVLVMRRRLPDAVRPYKVIAYPVLPIVFTLFCVSLVVITIIQHPLQACIGLTLIFSGIPVYLYYTRWKKSEIILP
jgi:APA family basic amino acid/polyamine antiporter